MLGHSAICELPFAATQESLSSGGKLSGAVSVGARISGTVTVNPFSTPVIFMNRDNKIKVTSLYDTGTSQYINDATGTWEVLDIDGVLVAGFAGSLTYRTSSNGNYVGYLSNTLAGTLTRQTRYQVAVSLASQSRELYRRVPVIAEYRGVN